jgi:hypothetical protein
MYSMYKSHLGVIDLLAVAVHGEGCQGPVLDAGHVAIQGNRLRLRDRWKKRYAHIYDDFIQHLQI